MTELFNMSDLKETLGVTITAQFIADTLGIEADAKDKRSSKYTAATLVKIIDAYIAHLETVRDEEKFVHFERDEKPAKASPTPAPAPADDEGEDW